MRGSSQRAERRRLLTRLAVTTMLASGFAAPALAEAPHPNLDANGVDLTTGGFYLNLPVGSIGSGDTELPLIVKGAAATNWSLGYLTQTLSGSTKTIRVNIGAETDVFSGTGTTLTSTQGTGATLTIAGDYIYRYRSGRAVRFSNPVTPQYGSSNLCDGNNQNNCTLLAASDTGLGALTISYQWTVSANCSTHINPDGSIDCVYAWRLGEVSNTAGYSITFSYLTNSVPFHQPPPSNWFKLSGAQFTNSRVGASSWPSVVYAYPSSNVVTITTPGDRTWRLTTDTSQTVVRVKRPGASSDTMTIAYGSGGVTSVTNEGVTTSYNRTVSGNTATMVVIDAQSHQTTIVSDIAKDRPTSVTDALGNTTTYEYDSLARPTTITYPEGNKLIYAYDARGNLTSTRLKAKPSVGGTDLVTQATYPSSCSNVLTCNRPIWTKDAKGHQTDYSYDPDTGLPTSVTMPAPTTGATRPQTRYSYTAVAGVSVVTGVSQCQIGSAPACVGTADEVKTTISYDNNLNPTSISRGAGNGSLTATTTNTYDAIGNLLTVDGPLAGTADTTTYRYDADRALTGTISADPDGAGALKRRAVKTTYNADGQPIETEAGTVTGITDAAWAAFVSLQQMHSTYDGHARKTEDTLTAGGTTYGVTQYSYDTLGRLDCTAVRMNSAVWGTLPASACTLQATGSAGLDRITRLGYDADGRVITTTSAYGVSGQQSVDATASYSANGKVVTLTDAENNRTTYIYDGFDRLLKTEYPLPTKGSNASSAADYEQRGYDTDGNVISRRLRDGTSIAYGYDALDRLISKNLPGSEPDVSYGYDNLGRPVSISQTGNALSFSYDALSRLLTETGPQGTLTSTWDVAGRRTKLKWPDGFYVTYDYDVLGEMTKVRENGATSGAGVLASYSYDNLGNRIGAAYGNGTTSSWTPDAVSRLHQLAHNLAGTNADLTRTFTYNPAGGIASATSSNDAYAWGAAANVNRNYTANGLNQYTASGSTSLSYDTRGNLTTSGVDSYTYSSENLMKTGPGNASLAYDPLLRLYQVTKGSSTTRFAYDGLKMVGEYNASNALQKRYVYGPGTDEPIVQYSGTGTTSRIWLMADERGSVIALADSSGTETAINSYDEYGIPGSGNSGRFQYTGQAWLPEIGMYYYKARMYSPSLGRFMQTDPIGYADGLNWYNYVESDPVNFIDPWGFQDSDIIVTGSHNCGPRRHFEKNQGDANGCVQDPIVSITPNRISPQLTGGYSAAPPQNGTRALTPREKRILRCNGASQADVDTFSVSSGLPFPFNLNSRVDGVTLSPIPGVSIANLRDGIGEMTSSRAQFGLIAHEFAHHIQYRQGMTLSSYLSEAWSSGYYDSMYEEIARDFSKEALDNWDNGKCR